MPTCWMLWLVNAVEWVAWFLVGFVWRKLKLSFIGMDYCGGEGWHPFTIGASDETQPYR